MKYAMIVWYCVACYALAGGIEQTVKDFIKVKED